MSLLFPDIALNNITEVTKEMLHNHNIKGLIVDIDNTLTLHNSQEIEMEVENWLGNMRVDFDIILLSNNYENRVAPFAKMLNIEYISMGSKPIPSRGLRKAAGILGLNEKEIAVIGDQIFTDILGGNLLGTLTIRVEPLQTEGGIFFNIKRWFENLIMRSYNKRVTRND